MGLITRKLVATLHALVSVKPLIRWDKLASSFKKLNRIVRCHHIDRTTTISRGDAKHVNDRLLQTLTGVNFSRLHHHLHNIVNVCFLHAETHTHTPRSTQDILRKKIPEPFQSSAGRHFLKVFYRASSKVA